MKTAKFIINQFLCDFRQLGWIMAVWVGWVGTEALVSWWRWHGSAGAENHHNVVFFAERILPLIGGALVVILAPALAFCHSLWRSDAFWRTRPIPVGHLYLTRIGFLIATVGVIPFGIRFAVLMISGVEPTLGLSQAAGFALIYLAGAIPLWALAMHFPKWRYFAITVCIVPMVLPILLINFSHLPNPDAVFFIGELPAGLAVSRSLIGFVFLIAGGLLAGGVLFGRRLRWAGAGILGLATIGVATIPSWWQVNLFDPVHLGKNRSAAEARVKVMPGGASAHSVSLEGELSWKIAEVPDRNWMGQINVATRYPNVHSPLKFERRIPISDSPEMEVSAQIALEEWGEDPINQRIRNRIGEFESIWVPLTKTVRMLPNSWQIRGEVRVDWFDYEFAAAIPLEPGARFLRDGNLFFVDDVKLGWDPTSTRRLLTIVLVPDRVRTWFTGNEYWNGELSSEPFQNWQLGLLIPAGEGGKPGRFDSYFLGKTDPTHFPGSKAIHELIVFDKTNPEQPPMITEETLPGCRLAILRPIYRETMFVPVEGGSDPKDAPVDGTAD